MLPTVGIGPLVIPTGGLVYILGAWLALTVVEQAAKRLDLDVPATYGVAVVTLVGGFLGARAVFVAMHWSAYAANPLSIVWPLTTGFSVIGGVLIGPVAGLYYGRWKQLPLAATLDALAPGIIVALMVVSLADFLAGPGYGKETTAPWGIDLFGIQRHAVQLYELLVGGAALLTWWIVHRQAHDPGRPFLLTVAVYSAGRLLVDAFRAGSPLIAGGYHLVQIAALALLIVCLVLLVRSDSNREAEQESDSAMQPAAQDNGR